MCSQDRQWLISESKIPTSFAWTSRATREIYNANRAYPCRIHLSTCKVKALHQLWMGPPFRGVNTKPPPPSEGPALSEEDCLFEGTDGDCIICGGPRHIELVETNNEYWSQEAESWPTRQGLRNMVWLRHPGPHSKIRTGCYRDPLYTPSTRMHMVKKPASCLDTAISYYIAFSFPKYSLLAWCRGYGTSWG